MKFGRLMIFAALMMSATSAFAVEQTICFSQEPDRRWESLGDTAIINGGKCNGVTLGDMNAKGWRLVQVVPGLSTAFGMVFEKVGPADTSVSKSKSKK